jgi:hypothetical protein
LSVLRDAANLTRLADRFATNFFTDVVGLGAGFSLIQVSSKRNRPKGPTVKMKSSKQSKNSKATMQLKDIKPKRDPSGGGKPKVSDIPVVKTSDKASPVLSS